MMVPKQFSVRGKKVETTCNSFIVFKPNHEIKLKTIIQSTRTNSQTNDSIYLHDSKIKSGKKWPKFYFAKQILISV